jgi:hypothetical protein
MTLGLKRVLPQIKRLVDLVSHPPWPWTYGERITQYADERLDQLHTPLTGILKVRAAATRVYHAGEEANRFRWHRLAMQDKTSDGGD